MWQGPRPATEHIEVRHCTQTHPTPCWRPSRHSPGWCRQCGQRGRPSSGPACGHQPVDGCESSKPRCRRRDSETAKRDANNECEACKRRDKCSSYRNRRVALRALGLENLLTWTRQQGVRTHGMSNQSAEGMHGPRVKSENDQLRARHAQVDSHRQNDDKNAPFLTSPIALKFSGMRGTAHVDAARRGETKPRGKPDGRAHSDQDSCGALLL